MQISSPYTTAPTNKMSATTSFVNIRDLDVSKVTIGQFKPMGSGPTSTITKAYVNYPGMRKFFLMTDKLLSTMGISEPYEDNGKGKMKYALNASFPFASWIDYTGKRAPELPPTDHADYEMVLIFKKFWELEEHLVNLISENSAEWLKKGKKISVEAVREYHFYPIISYDTKNGGKYPPKIKLKALCDRDKNTFDMTLFDADLQRVDSSLASVTDRLHKGIQFSSVQEFDAIYNINGKLSPSLTIQRLRTLNKAAPSLPDCPFGEAAAAPVPAPEPAAAAAAGTDDVTDDMGHLTVDDTADEAAAEAEEPPQLAPPKPARRRAAAKL